MKKILVVDDSALMRRVICDIINSDSNLEAKDFCRDGLEAYEKIKENSYDAVILDVNMPRMDGLQLLEVLHKEKISVKVIVASTLTTRDADVTIKALELGAVDFVTKPNNVIEAKGESFQTQLLSVLSAVLKIRPTPSVARVPGGSAASANAKPSDLKSAVESKNGNNSDLLRPMKNLQIQRLKATGKSKLIALACSTGGPKALQDVIPFLDPKMDAPMVLVQHMPVGFTKSMAERLNEISKVNVKEAEDGEKLQKGWVYVAPGGKHLEVAKNTDGSHRVKLSDLPPIGGLKPCANIMYDSLTTSGYDEIVCVVLTGMGADGTNGILTLAQKKPVKVIAQDEATCVVYGMPKAIADVGMVDEVLPLKEVAKSINKNVGVN